MKAINSMQRNNKTSHLCFSSHCGNKGINNGMKDQSEGKSPKCPICIKDEEWVAWGWKVPL